VHFAGVEGGGGGGERRGGWKVAEGAGGVGAAATEAPRQSRAGARRARAGELNPIVIENNFLIVPKWYM
jgi:hypothetical protein